MKGQLELRRIDQVHEQHLLLPVPQMLQARQQAVQVIQAIAEDDHQPPPSQPLGQSIQGRP